MSQIKRKRPRQLHRLGGQRFMPRHDAAPIRSTFPFRDGFPWDEELIRAGQRAVSTHGVYPVNVP